MTSLPTQGPALPDELSVALLDTLFGMAPVGLGVWDHDLCYLRVNERLAAINGVSAEEHVGRPVAEVLGPELGGRVAEMLRRVLETGEPVLDLDIEGVLPSSPGELRHWLASYYRVVGHDGRTLGVGGIVQEITERARAERERAELLERERNARAQAEAANRRAQFLAEASAVLDSSLDYETTLARVARISVPDVFDWCGIDMLDDDGALKRLATAHVDPAKEELARELAERYPTDMNAEHGVAHVMRVGQPQIFWEIPDELVVAVARDEEHLRMIRELGLRSGVVAPLAARGRTFGAVTFVLAESMRPLTEQDVTLGLEFARRASLAIDNARLYTGHRHIARTLQRSLLPRRLPEVPGVEIAVRYRAAGYQNEVGGDFYDLVPIGEKDGFAAIVGDVCGKGAEAAAVTALARYTLRAGALQGDDPAQMLRLLNGALREYGDEGDPAFCSFCTVGLVEIEPREGGTELNVFSGGHPNPIVLRADGRLETATARGPLIGVIEDPEWRPQTVMLEPGDSLVLYTDGVTEARADGVALGEHGLREVLGELRPGSPAARIVETVERAAVARQEGEPRDDIALVALRCAPDPA